MDKPIGLSELLKTLSQYEKMFGDIPVIYTSDNGITNQICNIDLCAVSVNDDNGDHVGFNVFINLKNKFDYSTLKKKEEEEAENEDQ